VVGSICEPTKVHRGDGGKVVENHLRADRNPVRTCVAQRSPPFFAGRRPLNTQGRGRHDSESDCHRGHCAPLGGVQAKRRIDTRPHPSRPLLSRQACAWVRQCVTILDVPLIACHAVERVQIRQPTRGAEISAWSQTIRNMSPVRQKSCDRFLFESVLRGGGGSLSDLASCSPKASLTSLCSTFAFAVASGPTA
jgi:hypothetical protein